MMITKEEFSQRRNYQKKILAKTFYKGPNGSLNKKFLSPEEREIISKLQELIDELKDKWDLNSKKMGLDVKRFNVIKNGEIIVKSISRKNAKIYMDRGEITIEKVYFDDEIEEEYQKNKNNFAALTEVSRDIRRTRRKSKSLSDLDDLPF